MIAGVSVFNFDAVRQSIGASYAVAPWHAHRPRIENFCG